jgi:hypothetical protein
MGDIYNAQDTNLCIQITILMTAVGSWPAVYKKS